MDLGSVLWPDLWLYVQLKKSSSWTGAGLHDLVHDVLGGIVFGGDFGYPGHASDVNVCSLPYFAWPLLMKMC